MTPEEFHEEVAMKPEKSLVIMENILSDHGFHEGVFHMRQDKMILIVLMDESYAVVPEHLLVGIDLDAMNGQIAPYCLDKKIESQIIMLYCLLGLRKSEFEAFLRPYYKAKLPFRVDRIIFTGFEEP